MKTSAPKRPTLAKVASEAGVSAMTASRALRKAPDVSAATIAKVELAAAKLGYLGNSLAQSFTNQRTDLVAVIMPSLTNTVFPEVLAGISEATERAGLQTVFGISEYDQQRELKAIRSLLAWKPAAFIVPGIDQLPEAKALLKSADIPVIQIMDLCDDPIDSCIGLSHSKAGLDMSRVLLDRHYTSFGYIGAGLEKDTRAAKRKLGFLTGLQRNGLDFVTDISVKGPQSTELGRKLMADMLDRSKLPEVVYFANDDLAAGAVLECMYRKLRVPEDVVIVGFNGLPIIDALPCKIVTSRSARYEMGVRAGELIVHNVTESTGRGQSIELPPTIEMGDLKE